MTSLFTTRLSALYLFKTPVRGVPFESSSESHSFVSSIRSNLVGTRFTVFNNGVNPKKGGVMSDGSNIREEVAAIVYVSILS